MDLSQSSNKMDFGALRRIVKVGMGTLALLAATSIGIGSTTASAYSCTRGTCGPHDVARVQCNGVGDTNPWNTVTVAPWDLDIRAVEVWRPGYAGGPVSNQWVKYRATLLKFNGTTFVRADYPQKPWVAFYAHSDDNGLSTNYTYYELHGNQWMPSTIGGRTAFVNLPEGKYRVSIEYYWWAANGIGDGYDVLPAEWNDYVVITSPYGDDHPGFCEYGAPPGYVWTFGG